MAYTAAVLTISDSSFKGTRPDLTGPRLSALLTTQKYDVVHAEVVPDEQPQIEAALIRACERAQLVITTGGTGVAPRDVTPEATRAVCERMVDGIPEYIRYKSVRETPFAALSRAACGTRGTSLIVNLPGNPNGAAKSMLLLLQLIPHALELLQGNTEH
jgi:molybdenum cofactor synthesis domain-containing protein